MTWKRATTRLCWHLDLSLPAPGCEKYISVVYKPPIYGAVIPLYQNQVPCITWYIICILPMHILLYTLNHL